MLFCLVEFLEQIGICVGVTVSEVNGIVVMFVFVREGQGVISFGRLAALADAVGVVTDVEATAVPSNFVCIDTLLRVD